MKHAWLALWLCLILMVPVSADVRQTPGQVTIATYNVENFFDVFDDPFVGDESTDPKLRHEIEKIALALRKMDADVIGVVEVENAHVLKAMVQEMLPDMGYDYIDVGPSNDGRGIKLGVISRLPILRTASYRHQTWKVEGYPEPKSMSRDLYHVTLDTGAAQPLELMGVHFKSKRDSVGDPQSQRRRNAEAAFTARIIQQQIEADPKAWIALVGDVNDTPDSQPVASLLDDAALVDVHTDLAANQRITYLREPYRSTIDYIFASPALAKRLKPGTAKVLDDPQILEGSDHAPIAATFQLTQ